MLEEFDEALYLLANPDVSGMLERTEFESALDHWKSTGADEHARGLRRSGFHGYDLVYDEDHYLLHNPDVAEAVQSGVFQSGYEHWIRHGRLEHGEGLRHGFEDRHGGFPPFRLAAGGGGEVLAARIAQAPAAIERVVLILSDRTRLSLDPASVTFSGPVELCDQAGRQTARELLLVWVPAELIQRNGHARRPESATLISSAGEVMTVTFGDVTDELPTFLNLDAAKALLLALKRLARVAGGALPVAAIGRALLGQLRPQPVSGPAFLKLHVEHTLAIEGVGIYATGWLIPASSALDRCRAFCPETGECVDFLDILVRSRRSDVWQVFKDELGASTVDQFGFTVLLPLPEASRLPECHVVLAITPGGGPEILSGPLVAGPSKTFVDAAKLVLGNLNLASPEFESLMAFTVSPAIETLWARERARKTRKTIVREIGERPARPRVSVVVPVYGRSDLIKYQLALFANDQDFKSGEVELVYFVDDPRLIETVVELAESTFPLYRVPLVCAFTGENHGFSGANNLGVNVARGELLILVNSDVVPKRAGWATQIARAYAGLPECGVLGTKLLYHDESLQHDGMSFERFPFWHGLYGNNHPGKGLPNRSELDAPAREVEAVTGACLAIERALYTELGGLSEAFVFGDFEDSELCLRVRKAKKRIFYLPSVELYHLERQSQSLLPESELWRWQLTVYNAWLQSRVWREFIDELKRSSLGHRTRGNAR